MKVAQKWRRNGVCVHCGAALEHLPTCIIVWVVEGSPAARQQRAIAAEIAAAGAAAVQHARGRDRDRGRAGVRALRKRLGGAS